MTDTLNAINKSLADLHSYQNENPNSHTSNDDETTVSSYEKADTADDIDNIPHPTSKPPYGTGTIHVSTENLERYSRNPHNNVQDLTTSPAPHKY